MKRNCICCNRNLSDAKYKDELCRNCREFYKTFGQLKRYAREGNTEIMTLLSDRDLMDELTKRGWKGGLGR